jgi:hypothetical protein
MDIDESSYRQRIWKGGNAGSLWESKRKKERVRINTPGYGTSKA